MKVLLGQDMRMEGGKRIRQQCEELPKEGDRQKEKMDGTWDKITVLYVHMMDTDSINYY